MKLSVAIAVARPGMLDRCLELLAKGADDLSQVHLLLFGNGLGSEAIEPAIPAGWGSVEIQSSPQNEGVPFALHRLWEMAKASGVPAHEDIVCYLHDDAFVHGAGWDTQTRQLFEDVPNCGLAGLTGAEGLGLDALYSQPYAIENLIRLNFMSNLLNAEAHGYRVLERRRVAVNDGYSLFVRRSLLDQIDGWSWWPFAHHNYDTAIACQCHRAGKEVWYIPVSSDHLSGFTANNEEGKRLLEAKGGEIAIHHASARYLYDNFRDVLPLRIR